VNGPRVVLPTASSVPGKNGERISYVVDTRALEKWAALEKLLKGKGFRP